MANAPEEERVSRVSQRGFASMDPDYQRELARKGGASVPGDKRSFSQDRALAAKAGKKGGENSHGGGGRRKAAPVESSVLDTHRSEVPKEF